MCVGKSKLVNFDPLCQVSQKPISKLSEIFSEFMRLEQAGEDKFKAILDEITQQYNVG